MEQRTMRFHGFRNSTSNDKKTRIILEITRRSEELLDGGHPSSPLPGKKVDGSGWKDGGAKEEADRARCRRAGH